jgi:hypothetical protein
LSELNARACPPACSTDLDALCEQIIHNEPLISDARRPQLRRLLLKLIEKQVRTSDTDELTKLLQTISASCYFAA